MRALMLLLTLVVFATAAQAASLEENFAQAQAAFKAGDYARAGGLFAAAGDQLHKSGDASRAGMLWGNAAVAHIKAENWAVAGDLYEKILATNKRLPQDQALRVYKNLVLCRGKLNQRALQIMAIERMLKAIPKLPPAELADVYARQGDAYRAMELYGPAAAAYDKAAHILPATAPAAQRARIFTAMGLCQGNLGDYTKATKSLEEARKLAGEANEALTIAEADSNLGILHLERGDYPKAMELIKRALEAEEEAKLRRSEGVDHNNLGLVYKAIGSHQEAMRRVEQSLTIAREVKNVRDEAIATVNRALLYRIAGQLHEARTDYAAAMKLFEQCGFQEGTAGALLGIGRMEALANKNYTLALENYQKALDIYTKLSLPRGKAETLLQLGEVYKYIAAPGRTTRDLVFDDEPTLPAVAPNDALAQSRKYFAQALELAQQLQSREMIWSAHQGLGYADLREGKLEDALKHYQTAIDIVTAMYVSLENVELLGEYMAGKEDLYGEAQEVCAGLYEKTRDKKYLDLQMRYSETLRNEVQKASTALVQMKFEDKSKQRLYEQLCALGREQNKAAKAIPVAAVLPTNPTPEQKAEKALSDKAATEQKAKVQKLEGDYKKLLAEWEKKYPEDRVIFQSAARVDAAMIQKHLEDDWIALQYTTLPDTLLITVVTKTKVDIVSVDVSRIMLEKLIKEKFLVEYVTGTKNKKYEYNKLDLKEISDILKEIYGSLIKPIEDDLVGKKRIYIIASGYLSQFPFGALVTDIKNNNEPEFLIEKFEIGYLRPSFVDSMVKHSKKNKIKKLLAIGNTANVNYIMEALPGTVEEVSVAYRDLSSLPIDKTVAIDVRFAKDVHSNVKLTEKGAKLLNKNIDGERRVLSERSIHENFPGVSYPPDRPTERWLREKLSENGFEILYMATHGMPYSNTVTALNTSRNMQKRGEDIDPLMEKTILMVDKNLKCASPLNGFVYMSSEDGDDILKGDVPEDRDGLLTMKEILELPPAMFASTKFVILSACNTGVTLIPKAYKLNLDESIFDTREIEKALRNLGLFPGVDQVSFVEAFMRCGVRNVFGTFWPVDDQAAPTIMRMFIENLVKLGENPDAITAYTNAQRQYIADSRMGKETLGWGGLPHHPQVWAPGVIFGK